MGIYNKNLKISNKNVKNQILTKEQIKALRDIEDSEQRLKIIKKAPYVLPYVLNSWSDDDNIVNIVETAIKLMPENVTKLGKGNIVPTASLVNIALEQKPSVIFSLNEDLKEKISVESFVKAFAKDPEICACDAPVLKERIKRYIEVERKGKFQKIKYSSTVRNECLKAIRIAMGVSKAYPGYDDFSVQIAKQLKANKVFSKFQTKDKMATKLATVVNSMIKNQDVRIYAMPVEVWKLNNYKPLYLAVKESTKKNSKINGILEFIPFDLLPEKITKKVVATALKKDPYIWHELEQYNLEYLKEDSYIQYVTYDACKKQNCLYILEPELSDEEMIKAENKINGVNKRKETRYTKAQKTALPSVIYKLDKKEEKSVSDEEEQTL